MIVSNLSSERRVPSNKLQLDWLELASSRFSKACLDKQSRNQLERYPVLISAFHTHVHTCTHMFLTNMNIHTNMNVNTMHAYPCKKRELFSYPILLFYLYYLFDIPEVIHLYFHVVHNTNPQPFHLSLSNVRKFLPLDMNLYMKKKKLSKGQLKNIGI